jgi:hypothetical protein
VVSNPTNYARSDEVLRLSLDELGVTAGPLTARSASGTETIHAARGEAPAPRPAVTAVEVLGDHRYADVIELPPDSQGEAVVHAAFESRAIPAL